MIPKPIRIGRVTNEIFNTSNNYTYCPYKIFTNRIEIIKEWFDSILPKTQNTIIDLSLSLHFTDFGLPHDNYRECVETEANVPERLFNWYKIYHAYLVQFSYDVWFPYVKAVMPDVAIIKIPSFVVPVLCEATRNHILTGREIDNIPFLIETIPDFRNFIEEISRALNIYAPAFVKTGKSSGKQGEALHECNTLSDVLSRITCSKEQLKEYEFYNIIGVDLYVILTKWREIHGHSEFRVFIKDREIVGIAQQHWYRAYNELQDQSTVMNFYAAGMVNFYKNELRDRLPYPCIVLDMYVDTKGAHLIECNPGGESFSSGSSLFEWNRDRDILTTRKQKPQTRWCIV